MRAFWILGIKTNCIESKKTKIVLLGPRPKPKLQDWPKAEH